MRPAVSSANPCVFFTSIATTWITIGRGAMVEVMVEWRGNARLKNVVEMVEAFCPPKPRQIEPQRTQRTQRKPNKMVMVKWYVTKLCIHNGRTHRFAPTLVTTIKAVGVAITYFATTTNNIVVQIFVHDGTNFLTEPVVRRPVCDDELSD